MHVPPFLGHHGQVGLNVTYPTGKMVGLTDLPATRLIGPFSSSRYLSLWHWRQKSESWRHDVALYVRAVAKRMRSTIGSFSLTLTRAEFGEISVVKSIMLPCCIKATAFNALFSPRCSQTRLKTSYKLTLGFTCGPSLLSLLFRCPSETRAVSSDV